MEQKYLQQDATIKTKRDALEKFTTDYTANYFSRSHQNQINSDTILFVIPVVFHIMHNYGPENISKAQILDAVRNMNDDFQKLNADTNQVISQFQSIIGDAQVEFRLAQLDPQGNCTDGITRHQTTLTNGGDDLLKAIVWWPADKYLNIWVENSTPNGFAAYSNYPGVSAALDGIVCLDEYVGTIGTSASYNAHILSHEAGHYFNLIHVWGSTNTPGVAVNCSTDDLVFDTPNTIGSSGCNLNQSTCSTGLIDNVQNIMDYSSCPHMFTQGQAVRMQAALNSTVGDRNNLWSLANLLLTGTNDGYVQVLCAPIADVTDKTFRICEGDSITFNNLSYGGDFATIDWLFTGGNSMSSTDTNPTITYNTAGAYDITLTVTNSAGASTVTRTGLIIVLPATPTASAPALQDFETLSFPSPTWSIENANGSAWAITNIASVSGTYSIFLQNNVANNTTEDIFYSEGFNFSNLTAPSFNFKVAFANRNSSADDFKIYMSTNCGQTWNLRYSKSGNSLATTTDTSLNFIPTPNQWRQDGASINAAAGQSNVSFKFQFTSQGGNNIFIDDINIGGVTGLNDLTADEIGLTLSPNPALQQTVLNFELFTPAKISYSITDVTGRIVFETTPLKYSDGKQSIIIHKNFNAGIYFIKLKINEQQLLKKIVFEN